MVSVSGEMCECKKHRETARRDAASNLSKVHRDKGPSKFTFLYLSDEQ